MAHARKLLRQAVVATLIAANTAAAGRVQGTRVDPWKKLPCISVYTLTEDVDPESATTAPRELERTVKLEIAGFVAHSDDVSVDDAMDDLAEQIEAAMDANRWLVNGTGERTAGDSLLESTTMEVVEDDGHSDPLVGIVTLTYSVTLRTELGAVATDDFLVAKVTTQIAGGIEDDTVPAEDQFSPRSTP